MDEKYLIYGPYRSGLSNMVMSLEVGFAIANATGRSLVLPPTIYSLFLTGGDRSNWANLWDIFDKKSMQLDFNVYLLDEIPCIKKVLNSIGSNNSWLSSVENYLPDVATINELPLNTVRPSTIADAKLCFVDESKVEDQVDLDKFCAGRKIVNLHKESKYLCIDHTAFQHYWYWIYQNGRLNRNKVKSKINLALQFNAEYYNIVDEFLKSKLSKFNAIHVRRNDFLTWKSIVKYFDSISTPEKLYEQTTKFFDTSLPLYIATDEVDRSFFELLDRNYQTLYIDHLYHGRDKLSTAIIEQIICSRAERFIGSGLSTYTKRINIMRGLTGKQFNDSKFLNLDLMDRQNDTHPLPWTLTESKLWQWWNSSHPQWMLE